MFSEIVDNVVLRSGRKDRLADIIAYVNQVVRETQGKQLYFKDSTEDTFAATATPTIWTYPKMLRKLRTVKYTATGYNDVYPEFRMPGKNQGNSLTGEFYYASSTYYVFGGTDDSQTIALFYYSWLPRLKYYAVGARPAVYDEATETWTYLVGGNYVSTTGSLADDEAAQALVTNWILLTYADMATEGGLAKIFKATGDARAGLCFSLYSGLRTDLEAVEVFESLGY